jgi:hypothetical protein
MLNQIISELCSKSEPARQKLNGGAWLDWQPQTATLTAERMNRLIDGQEARTFERYIRMAGFSHSRRENSAPRDADPKGLNTWMGVQWTLKRADDMPAQPKREDVQPNLFASME